MTQTDYGLRQKLL